MRHAAGAELNPDGTLISFVSVAVPGSAFSPFACFTGRPAVQLVEVQTGIPIQQVWLHTAKFSADATRSEAHHVQVWLGELGFTPTQLLRARSFWGRQQVLVAVRAEGRGCLLVCVSRMATANRLVSLLSDLTLNSAFFVSRPCLPLLRLCVQIMHWMHALLSSDNACHPVQVLPEWYCYEAKGNPVHTCAWAPSDQSLAVACTAGGRCGQLLVLNTALEVLVELPHFAACSMAWAPALSHDQRGESVLAYIADEALWHATLPGREDAASQAALAAVKTKVAGRPVTHVSYSLHGACMVAGPHLLIMHDLQPPRHGFPFTTLRNEAAELQLACLSPTGIRCMFATLSSSTDGQCRKAGLWLLVRQRMSQARHRLRNWTSASSPGMTLPPLPSAGTPAAR